MSKTRYRYAAGVALCVMAWMSAGCQTGPQANMLRVQATRVEEQGRLSAVQFISDFEVSGLENNQIIYEVRLLNRSWKLIRSIDNSYASKGGYVAAAKSLMVAYPLQTFEKITVTIPANQLEIRPEDLPVTAVAAIATIDGQVLAKRAARLPISKIEDIVPPMEIPPADESESQPSDQPPPKPVAPKRPARSAMPTNAGSEATAQPSTPNDQLSAPSESTPKRPGTKRVRPPATKQPKPPLSKPKPQPKPAPQELNEGV